MSKAKGKTEPAPFILFVGDMHVGGTTAVASLAECRNAEMERLHGKWVEFEERAKAAAKGKAFVLALGGDLVDGPRHHDTFQSWGTAREQRNDAIFLLLPLAKLASAIVAVKGTEVHAGADGQDDQTVAEELGAKKVPYIWRMTVGGRRLLWSHHGIKIPRDPWNATNAMHKMAVRLSIQPNPPDLAVFHHCHFSPPPVTANGVTVATVGCWQSPTAHGYKIRPEDGTSIGALAWSPPKPVEADDRWLYDNPDDYAYPELKAK